MESAEPTKHPDVEPDPHEARALVDALADERDDAIAEADHVDDERAEILASIEAAEAETIAEERGDALRAWAAHRAREADVHERDDADAPRELASIVSTGSREDVERLREWLLDHGREGRPLFVESVVDGMRCAVSGRLRAVNGRHFALHVRGSERGLRLDFVRFARADRVRP